VADINRNARPTSSEYALERIMLSSGGVGYFEYEATVDDNATLSLDVPLDQSTTSSRASSFMTTAALPARSPFPAASP
jgi:hypothetical protein